jgi:hypothetical protein
MSMSAHLAKGGLLSSWLADEVSGINTAMARAQSEARKKIVDFAATLTDIKPTFKDMVFMMEQGAEAWRIYTIRTAQADDAARKLREAIPKIPPEAIAGVYTLAQAYKDFGVKSTAVLTVEIQNAWKALNDAIAAGESPGVIEAFRKKFDELAVAIRGTAKAAAEAGPIMDILPNNLAPFAMITQLIEKLPEPTKKWLDQLENAPSYVAPALEKLKISFAQIAAAAQQVMGSFNSIFDQAQRNREIAIENEYKKRLAAINKNVKDEAARQKAIIALEAEYQIKRSSAAAAGAKQAKAVAMMEAVVNTASAVVSALKVFPPWLGIAFASVIGALGAVQIGLIAKQPIPLARGAVFTKPTLLPARYEVAEAGEPEIVSPKSTIRDAVREAWTAMMPQMALAGAGGATVNLYLTGPLIEAHGWSDSELRAGSDKLLAYVNEGLRKLGRKQL